MRSQKSIVLKMLDVQYQYNVYNKYVKKYFLFKIQFNSITHTDYTILYVLKNHFRIITLKKYNFLEINSQSKQNQFLSFTENILL